MTGIIATFVFIFINPFSRTFSNTDQEQIAHSEVSMCKQH